MHIIKCTKLPPQQGEPQNKVTLFTTIYILFMNAHVFVPHRWCSHRWCSHRWCSHRWCCTCAFCWYWAFFRVSLWVLSPQVLIHSVYLVMCNCKDAVLQTCCTQHSLVIRHSYMFQKSKNIPLDFTWLYICIRRRESWYMLFCVTSKVNTVEITHRHIQKSPTYLRSHIWVKCNATKTDCYKRFGFYSNRHTNSELYEQLFLV